MRAEQGRRRGGKGSGADEAAAGRGHNDGWDDEHVPTYARRAPILHTLFVCAMLRPDSPAVRAYFDTLRDYAAVGAAHEQAVKTAFHAVLQAAAAPAGWTLVPEFTPPGRRIRYDGALRDTFGFTLGYWEAKDEGDDLDAEIQRKIARGYRLQNTVFQAPTRAVLYQDGRAVLDTPLDTPQRLIDLLAAFLAYREPELERFHEAVAEFKARIPDLARGLVAKIHDARQSDPCLLYTSPSPRD